MARYDSFWSKEIPLTNSNKTSFFCGVKARKQDIKRDEIIIPDELEPFPSSDHNHQLKYLLSYGNIVYSTDFPNTNTNTYLIQSVIKKGSIEIIPTGYIHSDYHRFYIILDPLLEGNQQGIYPSVQTKPSKRIGDITELIPVPDIFLGSELHLEAEIAAEFI